MNEKTSYTQQGAKKVAQIGLRFATREHLNEITMLPGLRRSGNKQRNEHSHKHYHIEREEAKKTGTK